MGPKVQHPEYGVKEGDLVTDLYLSDDEKGDHKQAGLCWLASWSEYFSRSYVDRNGDGDDDYEYGFNSANATGYDIVLTLFAGDTLTPGYGHGTVFIPSVRIGKALVALFDTGYGNEDYQTRIYVGYFSEGKCISYGLYVSWPGDIAFSNLTSTVSIEDIKQYFPWIYNWSVLNAY